MSYIVKAKKRFTTLSGTLFYKIPLITPFDI
jgi:hypothetical protein